PVYNEAAYIERCMSSLIRQTFPKEMIEWLFIDGMSFDDTAEKIMSFSSCLNLQILKNEKRLVTYALNIGIQHAHGDYIIRMDAHAEYPENYIEKCVYYLEHTDADNVGGTVLTVGKGVIGEANSEILSSKFGVGNSAFRTGCESGYVDTVPFGAFRREIFKKIGLFNPDLPRSEDNDFNSRIRANGGKVYMAADIQTTYYCRDTVKGLLEQAVKNGNALFLTLRKNPSAMRVRHYIPFMFVLSLLAGSLLGVFVPFIRWVLAAEGVLYGGLDILFSLTNGKMTHFIYKFFMYPLFHASYGIGSFIGLLNIRLY
ncbi:MAG: glycosyltransferase family 2 protein, partial [Clostridia bacterium]|nr:glycosyltransferase family 2 protein [Clostridia bacterium]